MTGADTSETETTKEKADNPVDEIVVADADAAADATTTKEPVDTPKRKPSKEVPSDDGDPAKPTDDEPEPKEPAVESAEEAPKDAQPPEVSKSGTEETPDAETPPEVSDEIKEESVPVTEEDSIVDAAAATATANEESTPEVAEELKEMLKDIESAEPNASTQDSKTATSPPGKVTTENLISVLEDEPAEKKVASGGGGEPSTSEKASASANKPKKYLYKLKSKTGKVLRYTSNVPITLKRPVIHLTKMEEIKSETPKTATTAAEKEDADSDNSTKENNAKENTPTSETKVPRKKGRPPLSSKPVVITLDEKNEMKNRQTPIFSMQTRKRQLKFLPDGRLVTPEKRLKAEEEKKLSKSGTSSSDSDIELISSEDESSKGKKPELQKKFNKATAAAATSAAEHRKTPASTPGEKRKYKKVFDYESYYREKTGIPPPANLISATSTATATATTITVGDKDKMLAAKKLMPMSDATSKPKPIAPANANIAPKKPSSVDPAQLLSSLIGVPITQSQLNVVKFKPKFIQERVNLVTSTPKKVTFEEDRSQQQQQKLNTPNQSELLKSTPFKIVSKPTFQKILPKPSPSQTPIASRTTPIIQNRFIARQAIPITSTPLVATPIPTIKTVDLSLNDTLSKFDSFTDSRVVKTRDGPKKLKRKLNESTDMQKTIYDLMQDIFDTMPSWSLHVIPDTNSFCIAQVARGRMGIPILKKSIEFSSEFSAKVYVHQLHCKRYDGIYDTEGKIIRLIREIDALAA